MKRNYILLLLIICTLPLFSQNEGQNRFGKVSKAELDMKQYPKDKGAEAVVMYDLGKSQFIIRDNYWTVVYERTTRIKILTDAGVDEGNITIYYRNGEHVDSIQACTYNLEEGKIKKTELKPTNIFDEKIGYTRIKKFAMPNVRKGSVIEYTYQILSPYNFKLKPWNFQWRIPVVYSEDIVCVNPYFEYAWKLQGAKNFTYKNKYIDKTIYRFGNVAYQNMVYDMVMRDVPAFRKEPFISSINDYRIRVEFQLSKYKSYDGFTENMFNTWPDLVNALQKKARFGKYINKSQKLASKVMDMKTLEEKPEKVRFDSIMNYVKSNFTWDEDEEYLASDSPSNLLEVKSGNSADINLFTVGMLNKAGIMAYPVLISTRDHGMIKYNYPYVDLFNYVIIVAQVDGRLILTDATASHAKNDRIPPYCINHKGLIVMKTAHVKWINLGNLFPSQLIHDNIVSYANDQLNVKNTIRATENFALNLRNRFSNTKTKPTKRLESDNYTLIDSTISILNANKNNEPFILKYSYDKDPIEINGKLYISPFFNEVISDNPFKQDQRYYPIDMVYPKKYTYKTTIVVPKGYKVDHLPKSLTVNDELFSLNYDVQQDQGKIFVLLSYYFKKGNYHAVDYYRLKNDFDNIVNKGNDQIILSKI